MGVVGRSASVPNVASKICERAVKSAATTEIPRMISAWQDQLRHFNLQARSAENDSRRELQTFRLLNREEAQEVHGTLQGADDSRKVWEEQLWRDLTKVRNRVRALAYNVQFAAAKDEVQSLVKTAEHDLQALRKRTSQQVGDLATLEISLDDGLQVSLARFEGWCAQESALTRSSSASRNVSTRTLSCSRLGSKDGEGTRNEPDIAAIREQLDRLATQIDVNGGATGGWQSDDHDTFLRVLSKHSRRPNAGFLAELQQVLPHVTHEMLVAHISWQSANEERLLAKRQLLHRWRSIKSQANLRSQAEREFAEGQGREELHRQYAFRKREQKAWEARRRQVAEWRQAHDDALRAEENEQSRQARLAQEHADLARQRRTEAARQKVESFRLQRLTENELAQRAAESTQRKPTSDVRQRIAHRSAELLQRRRSQVQAKQAERNGNCFEPPERTTTKYSNVESRLEVHTEAYVEKHREVCDEAVRAGLDAKASPGNFAHQGVVRTFRSSPSWRPHFGV